MITTHMIGLFAIDLDDTLLNKEWRVSDRNRAALGELAASGVEVCIISGRMPDSMKRIVEPLEFVHYIGSYHGAIVQDLRRGRIIATCPLPLRGLVEIVEWKAREKYRGIYFVGERAIAEAEDAVVNYYRERTGAAVLVPDNAEAVISNMEVSKIVLYDPREPYQKRGESASEVRIYGEASALNFSGTRCFKTGLGYIEFTNGDATKAFAVRSLCQALGILPAAAAAIGDSYNDLDMLKAVGLSFAVANAVSDVRQAVHHVVADNDADGVADAVDMLLQHNGRLLSQS